MKKINWFAIIIILLIVILVIPFLLFFGKSLIAPFINPVRSDSGYCPMYLTTIQAEDKTETWCVATPRMILTPVWPLKFPKDL